MNAVLRYAKAHVALVGGLATWAVATFPGTQAAHIAAAVLAVLTALGVYIAPNAKKARPTGGTSHHTVVLQADTGQFLAELKLAEAQTKKAAMAAKKARKAAPKDQGETFVWFVLVVLAACLGSLLAHLILKAV